MAIDFLSLCLSSDDLSLYQLGLNITKLCCQPSRQKLQNKNLHKTEYSTVLRFKEGRLRYKHIYTVYKICVVI